MLVEPIPQRSTVSEGTDGLRISSPPRRGWRILFFAVWLVFWTYGGFDIGRKLLNHFDLFSFLWVIGWAVAEFWVIGGIIYSLLGNEFILASEKTVTRKTGILGIGLTRTYLSHAMRDLRYKPEIGSGRSRRASCIAFDYGAKTVRFASDIDEAEAANLIGQIKRRCSIAETLTPQQSGIKFWHQG